MSVNITQNKAYEHWGTNNTNQTVKSAIVSTFIAVMPFN